MHTEMKTGDGSIASQYLSVFDIHNSSIPTLVPYNSNGLHISLPHQPLTPSRDNGTKVANRKRDGKVNSLENLRDEDPPYGYIQSKVARASGLDHATHK